MLGHSVVFSVWTIASGKTPGIGSVLDLSRVGDNGPALNQHIVNANAHAKCHSFH